MDGDLARQLPSIDQVARATHNERARQRFVSSLRKRVMVDMPQHLRAAYENVVLRDFKRQKSARRATDARSARRCCRTHTFVPGARCAMSPRK